MDTQALIMYAFVGVLLPLVACAITVIILWRKPLAGGIVSDSGESTDLVTIDQYMRGGESASAPTFQAKLRRVIPAIVLLITVIAAQHFAVGELSYPPRDALSAVSVSGLIGFLLGVVVCFIPFLRADSDHIKRYIVMIFIAAILIGNFVTLPRPYTWLPMGFTSMIMSWIMFRTLLTSSRSIVAFLPIGIWIACNAAVLISTGSARQSQIVGSVAFALLGLFIASLIRKSAGMGDVVLLTSTGMVGGALAQGVQLGETPRQTILIMSAVAPMCAVWAIIFTLKSKHRPILASILGCITIVAVTAALIAWYLNKVAQNSPAPTP